jgi:hypothetical protein
MLHIMTVSIITRFAPDYERTMQIAAGPIPTNYYYYYIMYVHIT